jgi:Immunity protein 31
LADIDFYEIVDVLASPRAVTLGIHDSRGVVVGVAGDGDEKSYAILVGSRTFMLDESDLARTGERVPREAIYGGESTRVFPERYPDVEQ